MSYHNLIELIIIFVFSESFTHSRYIYIIHLLIKSITKTDEHDEASDYPRLSNLPYQSYIPPSTRALTGPGNQPTRYCSSAFRPSYYSPTRSFQMKILQAIAADWKRVELISSGCVPALP